MKWKFLVLCGVLITIIISAGCTTTTSPQQSAIATPTPQIIYVTVTVTPSSVLTTPAPISTGAHLQGRGDDVQSFTATGSGLLIFTMSYSGQSNFAVWLKDNQGNKLDLLANEIGSYSGKKSTRLDSGTYYLDVTASGPWTIDVSS